MKPSFAPRREEAGFVFSGARYHPEQNRLQFCYEVRSGKGAARDFEENFHFDNAPAPDAAQRRAIAHCLPYAHLALGVSYYKAHLPPRLVPPPGLTPLPAPAADFFNRFYRKGLGEFLYRNRLPAERLARFEAGKDKGWEKPPPIRTGPGVLVPCGGGMGSALSLLALKNAGHDVLAVTVGGHHAPRAVARALGLDCLQVRREMDPRLAEHNAAGAYNGHVPITGMLSFVFAIAAILSRRGTVVMSNEKSASQGNALHVEGVGEVNHQWSKSEEFEAAFSEFLPEFLLHRGNYFSLLRPWHELELAGRFARAAPPALRTAFVSCNRAFARRAEADARWCGDCDKCRFMFLILSPFLPAVEMEKIFGKNLFAEEGAADAYLPLFGLAGAKPFDCVGTAEECRAALALLGEQAAWRNLPAVAALQRHVPPQKEAGGTAEKAEFFAPHREQELPADFRGVWDGLE